MLHTYPLATPAPVYDKSNPFLDGPLLKIETLLPLTEVMTAFVQEKQERDLDACQAFAISTVTITKVQINKLPMLGMTIIHHLLKLLRDVK